MYYMQNCDKKIMATLPPEIKNCKNWANRAEKSVISVKSNIMLTMNLFSARFNFIQSMYQIF